MHKQLQKPTGQNQIPKIYDVNCRIQIKQNLIVEELGDRMRLQKILIPKNCTFKHLKMLMKKYKNRIFLLFVVAADR